MWIEVNNYLMDLDQLQHLRRETYSANSSIDYYMVFYFKGDNFHNMNFPDEASRDEAYEKVKKVLMAEVEKPVDLAPTLGSPLGGPHYKNAYPG